MLYDKVGSDHLPLETNIFVSPENAPPPIENRREKNQFTFIKWEKLVNDIKVIDDLIITEISDMCDYKAFTCIRTGCCKKVHLEQLAKFYAKLCHSVTRWRGYFVKQLTQINKFKVTRGWNRNVKHLYSNYREKYLNWIINGKMRDGPEFAVMRETRKLFKSALNDCKLNESRELSSSIQEKYENRYMKSFWFDVQQKNNRMKYSEIIDGKKKI